MKVYLQLTRLIFRINCDCAAIIWALDRFFFYFKKLPVKVVRYQSALTTLTNSKSLSSKMVRWSLKFAEYNVEIDHRAVKKSSVADTLSRNLQECTDVVEEVKVCILSSLLLRSTKQLIQAKKDNYEFCGLYRYFEYQYGISSTNATMFENFSQFLSRLMAFIFIPKLLIHEVNSNILLPQFFIRSFLRNFTITL